VGFKGKSLGEEGQLGSGDGGGRFRGPWRRWGGRDKSGLRRCGHSLELEKKAVVGRPQGKFEQQP
jgi:hypothetical protein